jgi:hypothetical protein
MKREKELFDNKQEAIYGFSNFLSYKWYRKLFGGKWRLLKFGKDTPYIYLFATWTKRDDSCFEGYIETIDVEVYPETGVDSRWKLRKQFIKNILRIK